jgi:hypothetical protein
MNDGTVGYNYSNSKQSQLFGCFFLYWQIYVRYFYSHGKSNQNALCGQCYLDKQLLISSSGNSRKEDKINTSVSVYSFESFWHKQFFIHAVIVTDFILYEQQKREQNSKCWKISFSWILHTHTHNSKNTITWIMSHWCLSTILKGNIILLEIVCYLNIQQNVYTLVQIASYQWHNK